MLNNGNNNDNATMTGPSFSFGNNVSNDVLIDVIDSEGKTRFINQEQALTLGIDQKFTRGLDMSAIYEPESVQAIKTLFARSMPEGFQTTIELSLIGTGGLIIRTVARCRRMTIEGETVYRLAKLPFGSLADELDDIRIDNKILKQIVDNANEGHWCIEFLEPVDLNNAKDKIVDQIFENASMWRITNNGMERLYELPSGESIRAEDVRLYWPRSSVNEEFVSQIVDAGFYIDGAVAVDQRHDGTLIYVENDVRADIEDELLLRIWGNCRDVTDVRRRLDETNSHLSVLNRVIDGVPNPILVFDSRANIILTNQAFLSTFPEKEKVRSILMKKVAAGRGQDIHSKVELPTDKKRSDNFECHVAYIPGSDDTKWNVLTLNKIHGAASLKVSQ